MFVALLTAGWIFPLALACQTYFEFWQLEAWPLLRGGSPTNSFPFLEFAKECFQAALLWLGLVVFAWAYIIAMARNRPSVVERETSASRQR